MAARYYYEHKFSGFHKLPHLKGFVLETYTHLAVGINEGICLVFPALAPK